MSGATIGGVVGAVVGFWLGGPQGAQVGWMVGSAVGGYVDPTQVQGPRLQDLRGQSSAVGGSIPRGWGTFPAPCNVIWQQPGVTEHKHTDDGKGSGTEQVTYTYTRSYALMFHIGEIAGVLQIKRNGKIVYDARDDDTLEAEYLAAVAGSTLADALHEVSLRRAMSARFINRCTIYKGTQDQSPDPTIESYKGVNNVPSYRGRAYMVVTDDDVTDLSGAIPQYEVIVATDGDVSISEANTQPIHFVQTLGTAGTYIFDATYNGSFYAATFDSQVFSSPDGEAYSIESDGQTLPYRSCASGGGIVVVRAETNKVIRLSSGTWSVVTTTNTDAYLKTFFSEGNFVCVGFGSSAEYSSDLGLTWHNSPRPASSEIRETLVTATSALCFGAAGAIHRTTNGGVSWTTSTIVGDLDPANAFTAAATDGITTRAYKYATSSLFVYTSTDDGVNFDCVEYVIGSSSYQANRMIYANGQWVGMGPVDIIVHYPTLFTSLDGLPPFTKREVVNGSSAASAGSNLTAMADSGESLAIFGNMVDGTGFAYLWEYACPGTPIPDAPGFYVAADGTVCGEATEAITPEGVLLATIVADICELDGIATDEYDVSQLTDLVTGYVIARETDGASAISGLQSVYFFDPAEWDAKLRFIKRGGTAVASINGDDLVERDGDPFEREKIQEVELLRRVSVGYLDTSTAYAPNTQKWERRVGTIDARGESTSELPLVMDPDDAATAAKRRGLTAWGETEKQRFSLPYRLAALTPTDIVNYTHSDGQVLTVRLMRSEDDGGTRFIESIDNCAEAYDAVASGTVPKPPTWGPASLLGPTRLVVMDLPIWRTTDSDELGLYVAAAGYFAGWPGAQIDVSSDSGVTYVTAGQATEVATIGYTTTSIDVLPSSEELEEQTLTVYLPSAPSSVSYETLLRYANRAALQLDSGEWEILQYQTVTPLGDDLYELSGLVRGRYNTTPGASAAGNDFVLLDTTIQFMPTPRDLLWTTISIRATTYGTSADAAVPFDYDFTYGASQTEWPPHFLEGDRDSAGDVTVTWIGRARLGTETSPYHSVHFVGYRISFTSGVTTVTKDVPDTITHVGLSYTYSVSDQISDFGSLPGSLDISVAALNNITGASQDSEQITI